MKKKKELTLEEKFKKVIKYASPTTRILSRRIDKMRRDKVEHFMMIGLKCALESSLKSDVKSTLIDAEMAYVISDYYCIYGLHWENLEPFHIAKRRAELGSIFERDKF